MSSNMFRRASSSSSSGSSFDLGPGARVILRSPSPPTPPRRSSPRRERMTTSSPRRTRRVESSSSDNYNIPSSHETRRFVLSRVTSGASTRQTNRSNEFAGMNRSYDTEIRVPGQYHGYGSGTSHDWDRHHDRLNQSARRQSPPPRHRTFSFERTPSPPPRSFLFGGMTPPPRRTITFERTSSPPPRSFLFGGTTPPPRRTFTFERTSPPPQRRHTSRRSERQSSSFRSTPAHAERDHGTRNRRRHRDAVPANLPIPTFSEPLSPGWYDISPPPLSSSLTRSFGLRLGDYSPDRSSHRRFDYSLFHRRSPSPSTRTGRSTHHHGSRRSDDPSQSSNRRSNEAGRQHHGLAGSSNSLFAGLFGRRRSERDDTRGGAQREDTRNADRGVAWDMTTRSSSHANPSLPRSPYPSRQQDGGSGLFGSWEHIHHTTPHSEYEFGPGSNLFADAGANPDDGFDDVMDMLRAQHERLRRRIRRTMRNELPPELQTRRLTPSDISPDGPTQCNICLDERGVGDEVAVLPCGHWFDKACMDTWMRDNPSCPVCRAEVE